MLKVLLLCNQTTCFVKLLKFKFKKKKFLGRIGCGRVPYGSNQHVGSTWTWCQSRSVNSVTRRDACGRCDALKNNNKKKKWKKSSNFSSKLSSSFLVFALLVQVALLIHVVVLFVFVVWANADGPPAPVFRNFRFTIFCFCYLKNFFQFFWVIFIFISVSLHKKKKRNVGFFHLQYKFGMRE